MTLDRFERREVLRAIASLIAVLDDPLAEQKIACDTHQRLTMRTIACPACRAEAMDAAYEQRTAEEASDGRD